MTTTDLSAPALRSELRAFEKALPELLPRHEGEYVVMRGNKIIHWAGTYHDALQWAYREYGLEPFFVKRVSAEQNIVHFTRELGPCGA